MATVDEVYNVVKDTQGKVDDLVQWKAGMTEACKAHRKETDELRETVFANPGGLRAKVEWLWNCKNGFLRSKDFWGFVVRALIVFGLIAVFTFAWKVAMHVESVQ